MIKQNDNIYWNILMSNKSPKFGESGKKPPIPRDNYEINRNLAKK